MSWIIVSCRSTEIRGSPTNIGAGSRHAEGALLWGDAVAVAQGADGHAGHHGQAGLPRCLYRHLRLVNVEQPLRTVTETWTLRQR